MCEPISLSLMAGAMTGLSGTAVAGMTAGTAILSGVTTAIGAFGSLYSAKQGQEAAAAQNDAQTQRYVNQQKVSNQALAFKYDTIQDRLDEEQVAYSARKQEITEDYWARVGRLEVASAEAGVVGINVEAIRRELGGGLGRSNTSLSMSLAARERQYGREMLGYRAQAQGQILSATPQYEAPPSLVGPMLATVSAGVGNLDYFSGGDFGQKVGEKVTKWTKPLFGKKTQ